jgi:branched-chain amino acid transport system ATP-binding protein
MLELSGVSVSYGHVPALRDFSLDVKAGEIHCLLGRNGAGKTTTMKAIMGLLPLQSGKISLEGEDVGSLAAHDVPRRGIGYVPQGRRLFAELTVRENIEIGLMVRARGDATRERVLDIFPRLRSRLAQRSETLSGGEQQMLAMARALCVEPKALLLDEPTEGLQPSVIGQIRDVIVAMKDGGVAVLLVEQRIEAVLSIADRVTFIENGQNRETVRAASLQADHTLLRHYLGV